MKASTVLTSAQGLLGAVLVARPAAVAGVVSGNGRPAPGWVVRILGLRMVAQAASVASERSDAVRARRALLIGAAVDAAHSASMLAVATWWRPYRRSALISGATAAAAAAVGLAAASSGATVPSARPAASPTPVPTSGLSSGPPSGVAPGSTHPVPGSVAPERQDVPG